MRHSRIMIVVASNLGGILAMVGGWAVLDWLYINHHWHDAPGPVQRSIDLSLFVGSIAAFWLLNHVLIGRTRDRLWLALWLGMAGWLAFILTLLVVAVPIHWRLGGTL